MVELNLKVYDKEKYQTDTCAINFVKYLEIFFGERQNYICYYEEPDYYVKGNFLPTFTILDKYLGVIVIKLFDYSDEMLTYISNEYWTINGSRAINQVRYFDDYCYTFKNDIFMPSNEISSGIKFTQIVCFPLISSSKIDNKLKTNARTLFDDYRKSDIFSKLEVSEVADDDWVKLIAIIQKANILNKDSGIPIDEPATNLSEAVIINNQKINKFDDIQLDASWTVTTKSERIRGLAGTGKTVILAIKAAKLHRKYPERKIAYVFYTQALYNQVNYLVNKYYHKIVGSYPDPDKLQVLHAWGGKTTGPGFYYNICNSNGLVPVTYAQVRNFDFPFGEACKKILDKELKEEYDYILIDEAQDLPLEFFRLAEKVTKKPAKITIAYDELQTTNDTKMLNFDELFGVDKNGKPKIVLDKEQDYILKKSYRNNIKVLMTAFAFGFGFYSRQGVTQIIRDIETWEALGFEVKENKLKYGEGCTIYRNPENSPNNVQRYYNDIEVINLELFDEKFQEIKSVAEKIIELIKRHNVKPEDIMLIDMDNSKSSLMIAQNFLGEHDIQSTIPGIIEGAKSFLIEGFVTLTTPRRAKGNEVPVVFVIGANAIYRASTIVQKRIIRNLLFVAITRSKGWVFISGSVDNLDLLKEEFYMIQNDISQEIPNFSFTFPSEELCNKLASIDYVLKDQRKERNLLDKVQTLKEIINSDVDLLNLFMTDEMKGKIKEFAEKVQRGDSE